MTNGGKVGKPLWQPDSVSRQIAANKHLIDFGAAISRGELSFADVQAGAQWLVSHDRTTGRFPAISDLPDRRSPEQKLIAQKLHRRTLRYDKPKAHRPTT